MRILKGNRMTNPDERLDLSDYPSPIADPIEKLSKLVESVQSLQIALIEQRDEKIKNLKIENNRLKKTNVEIIKLVDYAEDFVRHAVVEVVGVFDQLRKLVKETP